MKLRGVQATNGVAAGLQDEVVCSSSFNFYIFNLSLLCYLLKSYSARPIMVMMNARLLMIQEMALMLVRM